MKIYKFIIMLLKLGINNLITYKSMRTGFKFIFNACLFLYALTSGIFAWVVIIVIIGVSLNDISYIFPRKYNSL